MLILPNPFDLSRIVNETWIDDVHFYDQIESTNTAALEHSRQKVSSGAELFLAEQQSAGRGRGSNAWWSSAGALTFSMLTPPLAIADARLSLASLTVGVALCQAIEPLVPAAAVTLKWPNDIFLNGKKACGILIETAAEAPKRLVIGIGLNVNNSLRDAPAELQTKATSLIDQRPVAMPEAIDRTGVLIACLNQINECLTQLIAQDTTLADRWRGYSLLTGRWVRIETPSPTIERASIEGTVQTIADDGALIVQTATGEQACYGGVVAEYR